MIKITIECDDFFATTENPETAKQLLQMAGVIDFANLTVDCPSLRPEHFADTSKTISTIPISAELDEYLSKHDDEPLPTDRTDSIGAEARAIAQILTNNPRNHKLSKMKKKQACQENRRQAVAVSAQAKPSETTDAPDDNSDTENKLPAFIPAWIERDIDLNKNYIDRYSNPCSTLHGKCGGKCVQTEIWLRNKKTGVLSVCDVEFASIDDLTTTLDPYITLSKSAAAIAASQKLPCSRERLEQLAKLFNSNKSNAEIMEQCHISASSVATYRAAAKRCGLLNN